MRVSHANIGGEALCGGGEMETHLRRVSEWFAATF